MHLMCSFIEDKNSCELFYVTSKIVAKILLNDKMPKFIVFSANNTFTSCTGTTAINKENNILFGTATHMESFLYFHANQRVTIAGWRQGAPPPTSCALALLPRARNATSSLLVSYVQLASRRPYSAASIVHQNVQVRVTTTQHVPYGEMTMNKRSI